MRSLKSLTVLVAFALAAAACGGGTPAAEVAENTDAVDGATEEGDVAASETPPTEESAATGAGSGEGVRAAVVTDVGGLGDQSFNDAANRGLEQAVSELGIDGEVLESATPSDYVNNLTQLAENGFSPIFATGFLMTEAVDEVAPQFPDVDFALIDSVAAAPNTANLLFAEHEGSYLAGVAAGLMTQQDTDYTTADQSVVGFLGGLESPLIQRFEVGYAAGVASVCPDCEVLVDYAGTTPEAFNDPARGQEIALSQNDRGADVVYHASGATGSGLFEAATDRSFFAIGVDSDQAALVPEAPILTSMLKRVDSAVFDAIEQSVNGEFPAGETITYGLAEEGVGLAGFGAFADVVPEEVTTAVDQARAAILDGSVTVPDAAGG